MSAADGRKGRAGKLRTVRLCLLGFGSVARAFCALLAQQERVLADAHGLRVLVTAAGTLLSIANARFWPSLVATVILIIFAVVEDNT